MVATSQPPKNLFQVRYGIIVTAHKIVQTGFRIKIVTATTERIEVADRSSIDNPIIKKHKGSSYIICFCQVLIIRLL